MLFGHELASLFGYKTNLSGYEISLEFLLQIVFHIKQHSGSWVDQCLMATGAVLYSRSADVQCKYSNFLKNQSNCYAVTVRNVILTVERHPVSLPAFDLNLCTNG